MPSRKVGIDIFESNQGFANLGFVSPIAKHVFFDNCSSWDFQDLEQGSHYDTRAITARMAMDI